MADPSTVDSLLIGTMAAASVVLCGAFYALFFALGRLHGQRLLLLAALASYLLLAVACGVLVAALSLTGFWIVVTVVMLAGYLLLPQAVWYLCVGTHADEAGGIETGEST